MSNFINIIQTGVKTRTSLVTEAAQNAEFIVLLPLCFGESVLNLLRSKTNKPRQRQDGNLHTRQRISSPLWLGRLPLNLHL